MTASRRVLILWMAVCLLALTPAALAGPQRFTSINYPGATKTFALGINPAGDIVGAWDDKANNEHGFLLHAGKFTPFDFPGALWTDAYGITPDGDIIGQYGKADGTTQGFMLRIGERRHQQCCDPGVTELSADESSTLHFYAVEIDGPKDLGLPNTMPFGMSPDGTIAGCYHQSGSKGIVPGTMHGFVLNGDGSVLDPVANTMHTGINAVGDLTGYSTSDGRSYVIHKSDGSTEWFTVLGAAATRATGISVTGDVVGWYKDVKGAFHGFLRYADGGAVSIDVDFAGVKRTTAEGINAQGDIVGYYIDATGYHGFLLSRRSAE